MSPVSRRKNFRCIPFTLPHTPVSCLSTRDDSGTYLDSKDNGLGPTGTEGPTVPVLLNVSDSTIYSVYILFPMIRYIGEFRRTVFPVVIIPKPHTNYKGSYQNSCYLLTEGPDTRN